MIRLLAAVICICGSSAVAQTVSVRSGEHETFSRLVLSIPEGAEWQLGRTGEGYALALEGVDGSFDLSQVFERIPRTRISALASEEGSLAIDLGCDCHADAFLWRPDQLVVDVIDGPPPASAQFEAVFMVAPEEPAAEPTVALPILAGAPISRTRPPLLPSTFEISPPTDGRVAQAEQAIIESLARAASQGVFALPERPLPFISDQLPGDDEAETAALPPALTPVTDPMDGVPANLGGDGATNGPGLMLRTSIDRPTEAAPGLTDAEGHCIQNEAVSIQDWGDDRDYSAQLADKRRALTTEFDVYPTGAIEDMARTYLFFGFGQEARQTLALDGQRSHERMVLEALSYIVDGLPVQNRILADQLECDSFVVLWAALSEGTIEPVSEDGRNAAVMAFRLLPDPLRGHLGATLAQLFLDAGDTTTAEIIMTSATNLETGSSIESSLTSAALTEQVSGPEAAIEALSRLSSDSTRMTPQGLARLIELQVSVGQLVDPALLDLAESMRFEAGETEEAALLALAEIAAHASSGQFQAALSLANDSTQPIAEVDRTDSLNAIYMAMAERQSEAEFLATAFDALPDVLEPDTQNVIAARLIALGFPERARQLLSGPASQEAMAERRYLRAEAAAAMNDLPAVELALTGLSDRRASEIRSRAFAAVGDYESALAQDILGTEAVPNPDDAWRAGAWSLLETGEDPLLQSASRAILAETQALAQNSTLADRRSLLDEAVATRTMTEELLGRFPAPSGE